MMDLRGQLRPEKRPHVLQQPSLKEKMQWLSYLQKIFFFCDPEIFLLLEFTHETGILNIKLHVIRHFTQCTHFDDK